jgi:hypothetical protein
MGPIKDLKGVQRVMGCLAALSRFISRLGERGLPLYRLLRKAECFTWTPEAEEALGNLKALLTNAPERELGLHLVPKLFWWLNCPTQIIGLTSLPKCTDYTGIKGSHSANKKIKFWIQQRSKGQPKASLVWRTGLSDVPPDSVRCTIGHVRCTRGLQRKLDTFGNFQRRLRYNSPDCPVYTGQCPVLQGRSASGTRQLRETPTASPL